jgi:hypothetical protein
VGVGRWLAASALVGGLVGCPRPEPPVPLPVPPPLPAPLPPRTEGEVRVVRAAADLAGVAGRVTVVGTVSASAGGTDLVLGDGTRLRVQEQGVPAGWDWLVDTAVRVLGTPEERGGAWWLADPQTPMPADVGMEL